MQRKLDFQEILGKYLIEKQTRNGNVHLKNRKGWEREQGRQWMNLQIELVNAPTFHVSQDFQDLNNFKPVVLPTEFLKAAL